jgi:hypothetical protein
MPFPSSCDDSRWQRPSLRRLALTQAAFYVATGIWPLLHLPSFLAVTGPKVDVWLVLTVGALVGVTGVALGLAALRRRLSPEWAILAAGQAASLAAIDIVFVARERIRPIYLADAAVEIGLIVAWLVLASWKGSNHE